MSNPTTTAGLETRHIAVLTAIAIGLTADTAARRLGISGRTYRRIATEARDLLGAHSHVHAAVLATAAGHLDPGHLTARTLPPTPHGIRKTYVFHTVGPQEAR